MSHPFWGTTPPRLACHSQAAALQRPAAAWGGPRRPACTRAALLLALEMIRERKQQSTYHRSISVLVHLPLHCPAEGELKLKLAEQLSTFHQQQGEGTS